MHQVGTMQFAGKASQAREFTSYSGRALQSGCSSMLPPTARMQFAGKASQTKKFTSYSGRALQSGCSSMLPPAAKGGPPLEPRYSLRETLAVASAYRL